MPGKNVRKPRVCPECGKAHVSTHRKCGHCRDGSYGYDSDTKMLTYRLSCQPESVLADRAVRLLIYWLTMKGGA